ncbi:MAG: hypothetical protein HDR26_01520 [Lachnospiraceae bacterium]|nr:hypothetical protein [Lachnospiraceae bacterium]
MTRRNLWKPQLIKSLKIAAAAFIAIALAGEIGLKYSATAGIITVLSIQNTKRETLKSAVNRWLAFLCALFFSVLCFSLAGYRVLAFGMYLFLFALVCLSVGWTEAIAMDSVLVTHFLMEKSMDPLLLINETLLLLIGTGTGILVNLHLHKQQEEFQRLAGEIDTQMKSILCRMAEGLPSEDRSGYEECFDRLRKAIEEAGACAISNYGNTLFSSNSFELDYVAMREQQSVVLREIYDNILKIRYLPRQAQQVAALIAQIGQDFHRENAIDGLLKQQEDLLEQMKVQPLPSSREEFEARAILFYILMQIRQFLQNKEVKQKI